MSDGAKEVDVVVIGAGPGGYVAAFRAADLGLSTILIDEREHPGGVCLYEGCIPSKALLHVADLISEAEHAKEFGLDFKKPKIDLERIRDWKNKVVSQLTFGTAQLAKQRNVEFVRGRARFQDSAVVRVQGESSQNIRFKHAIVATGSKPSTIPGIELESPNLLDSTDALQLAGLPKRLLVVGAGYIGLEMGTVFASLGSQVTMVEFMSTILPGVDRDLVRPLDRRMKGICQGLHLNTKVVGLSEDATGLRVELEGEVEEKTQTFDQVLVAVGRRPLIDDLGLENTKVQVGEDGFVRTDEARRTDDPNIYAIGDVAGQPMLAHKAMREGKVAAEVIAGEPSAFDNLAIPAVVFTSPEIAWCGLTETEAKAQEREVKVTRFPWAASGRAITLGHSDGLTKMLFDPESGQVLGMGVVGPQAGELIAEGVLAIEMAALAEDLAATIHSHPTLSETVGEVAEAFLGQATHIYRK